jgi:diguanylate cyclase (GGDEF)-like protein/PAS domain S-box-containing protein
MKIPEQILQQAVETFQSEGLLTELIERCPIPIFVLDRQHSIVHWNKALAGISGLPAGQMLGSSDQWRAFYPSKRPTLADLILDGSLDGDIARYYQDKFRRSQLIEDAFEAEDFFPEIGNDGRWLFFSAAPLKNIDGQVVGVIETLQDVTTRRRAEAALQESRSFLAQIVDGSSVPTFVIDREHRVSHWNRACEVATGMPAREMIGTRDQWRAFYKSERPVMADLILSGALEQDVDRFYHGKFRPSTLVRGAFEVEDFFPHFGESGRWLFFTAAPLRDSAGRFIGAIETLQDITEQKRAEQAIRESEQRYRTMSITDNLTSLYNSRHFYEQLGAEIARANRYQRPLSLLLLDVDNFKKINDTYGHLEGDRTLQALAQAIKSCLRSADTAYRYGGEEFTVILPESNLVSAELLAERLRTAFANTPVKLASGDIIHCTVSIGISGYASPENLTSLVRRADDGVYRAKRQGKNCSVTLLAP